MKKSEKSAGQMMRVQFSRDGVLYTLPDADAKLGWLSVATHPSPVPPAHLARGYLPLVFDGRDYWRECYPPIGLRNVPIGKLENLLASDDLIADFLHATVPAEYAPARRAAMETERARERRTLDLNEAVADAIAAISEPELTPAGRVTRFIKQMAALPFPKEQQAEAAAAIRQFGTMARDLLERCDLDALWAQMTPFERRMQDFTRPAAVVNAVVNAQHALIAAGWTGHELDILQTLLKPGERIGAFAEDFIEIGGRRYTRFEVREAGRPASFTNRERWHSQFPTLPERAEKPAR